MNVAEPYAVLLAKLLEPEVGSIAVHRASVPLDEQMVVVLPLVAHTGALFVLFLSQLPQHIHNVLRVLLRSLGLLCFRCVGIDTFLCRVVGSSADFYRVVLKIHIFPFQSEQLTAAVSAVNSELEEHPELCRNILSVKKLKDTSDFLNRVDILFLCLALGYCDLSAGIVGEHIHLDRIAEYIGNEAQMMNDCLSRQEVCPCVRLCC